MQIDQKERNLTVIVREISQGASDSSANRFVSSFQANSRGRMTPVPIMIRPVLPSITPYVINVTIMAPTRKITGGVMEDGSCPVTQSRRGWSKMNGIEQVSDSVKERAKSQREEVGMMLKV
jgi:hypothetical protein